MILAALDASFRRFVCIYVRYAARKVHKPESQSVQLSVGSKILEKFCPPRLHRSKERTLIELGSTAQLCSALLPSSCMEKVRFDPSQEIHYHNSNRDVTDEKGEYYTILLLYSIQYSEWEGRGEIASLSPCHIARKGG